MHCEMRRPTYTFNVMNISNECLALRSNACLRQRLARIECMASRTNRRPLAFSTRRPVRPVRPSLPVHQARRRDPEDDPDYVPLFGAPPKPSKSGDANQRIGLKRNRVKKKLLPTMNTMGTIDTTGMTDTSGATTATTATSVARDDDDDDDEYTPDEAEIEYVAFSGDDDDGVEFVQDVKSVEEMDQATLRAMMMAAGDGDGEFDEFVDDEDDVTLEDRPRLAGKRLPAEVRCFDTARILVKGGDGGRGCVAFRREKFVPKGGPSGGNGGNGGSVYVEADEALSSLSIFRRKVHFRASPGTPGTGSDCHGAAGEDLVIKVPPGTIIRRAGANKEEPPLAEILREGERALLAVGGRGGRGNLAFKSGRNNAPTLAEYGEVCSEMWLDVELRLVADVGIIGVPNAGKSTLLSVLSNAKPKVADYPFTTLVPNLGVNTLDFRETVFADVPGLLEGAHSGIGLGHQFLRHCQRCKVLVHVIDGTSPDPLGDYDAIQTELRLFSPELAGKPQVVAYNKMDVPDSSDYWDEIQSGLRERGVLDVDVLSMSAVAQVGVSEVVRRVRRVLDDLPVGEETPEAVITSGEVERDAHRRADARIGEFFIEEQPGFTPRVFIVKGEAIERFAQMTDWSYYEATRRFQGVLDAAGITKALRAKGIEEGDTVVIGDMEFEHSDERDEGAMVERWHKERRMAGIAAKGSARWPHPQ